MAKRSKKSTTKKTSSLTRVAKAIVQQEQHLLQEVQTQIKKSRRPNERVDYDRELVHLRDALAEERLPDDQAMLLEQMDRIAALSTIRDYAVQVPVDINNPYFAHMQLDIDEYGTRDILLGRQSFLDGAVRVVDWRHAPISRVFYRYQENDLFAEEIANRQMEGQVLVRRTITIADGSLMRIASAQGIFLKTKDRWQDVSQLQSRLQGGAGTATRPDTARPLLGTPNGREIRAQKLLPEIAAQLDRKQFDLLTQDGSELLVVTGGAGSGKTTVGLHRLAYLAFANKERFRPKRMLVLVFGKALARYISRVLPALGVHDVAVMTLSDWAIKTRRRHFPELTVQRSQETPAVVVRFKTHRILIPMLEQTLHERPDTDLVLLFDELFSDRSWLSWGVSTFAPKSFTQKEIDQVHRWCADQTFLRSDPATADDEEQQPCYDEEDSMILLHMVQLRNGRLRFGKRRRLVYDHIMVDEVQDFSPLELMVLMATAKDHSVTLAGDPAQKITDNDFSNWGEVLSILGQKHVEIEPMNVSYRSTRPIMMLARDVLGPLAPDEPIKARRGAPVELIQFGGQGEAMTFLADALLDLVRREPEASVAVLTQNQRQAKHAYLMLRKSDLPRLSLIEDQDFHFEPGIEVTDIAQTKGLEFDYVVLLGVHRANYPKTDAARHLLHVGLTRAIHQLWILVWQPRSELLPKRLKPLLGG